MGTDETPDLNSSVLAGTELGLSTEVRKAHLLCLEESPSLIGSLQENGLAAAVASNEGPRSEGTPLGPPAAEFLIHAPGPTGPIRTYAIPPGATPFFVASALANPIAKLFAQDDSS